MKCIAYISKVVTEKSQITIPVGLSDVYRQSVKSNRNHNITGLLCYKRGHYFQLIEGKALDVDLLFDKISGDTRHKQITKILDVPIQARSFSEWNLKLTGSIEKEPAFQKFAGSFSALLSENARGHRELVELFYNLSARNNSTVTTDFGGKMLILIAWPDFNLVRTSPEMIEMCARMTFSPVAYDELVSNPKFGSPAKVDRALIRFNSLGVLKIESPDNTLPTPPAIVGSPSSPKAANDAPSDNFFNKMKKFLGLE